MGTISQEERNHKLLVEFGDEIKKMQATVGRNNLDLQIGINALEKKLDVLIAEL